MRAAALACLLSLALASPALAQGADAFGPPTPRATSLANAGRYQDAEALLVPWLSAHPGDQEARFLLARVRFWEGRPAESLAEYDRLLALSPGDPDYLLGKGRVLLSLRRPAEAAPVLERARVAAPTYEEVWQAELQAFEQLANDPARAGIPGQREAVAQLRAQALSRFPHATWLEGGAGAASRSPWQLELGGGYDYLTSGYAPWTELGAIVTRRFAGTQAGVLTLRDAGRFGLHDQELGLGWYQPLLDGKLTIDGQGTLSPGHQVLPFWSLSAGGYYALPWTLGVDLDLTQTAYTSVSATREMLVVDKYLGSFRLVYTLSLSELPGAPLALGNAGAVEYDYLDDDMEMLTAHTGQEMEFVGPGASNLLVSNVTGLELRGRTWIDRRFGITHGLAVESQGTSYNRAGVQLGVLVAF